MMLVLIAVDLAWVVAAAQARRWLKILARHAHRQPGECHGHGRCGDRDRDEMIRTRYNISSPLAGEGAEGEARAATQGVPLRVLDQVRDTFSRKGRGTRENKTF